MLSTFDNIPDSSPNLWVYWIAKLRVSNVEASLLLIIFVISNPI